MNIIHSSSLSASAALHRQQTGNGTTGGSTAGAPSTPAVEPGKALVKSGQPNTSLYNPANINQTQKALNAYLQNNNQSAKQQTANASPAIDYYA